MKASAAFPIKPVNIDGIVRSSPQSEITANRISLSSTSKSYLFCLKARHRGVDACPISHFAISTVHLRHALATEVRAEVEGRWEGRLLHSAPWMCIHVDEQHLIPCDLLCVPTSQGNTLQSELPHACCILQESLTKPNFSKGVADRRKASVQHHF